MTPEVDFAWATGLFEGEGTVYKCRGHQAKMALSMTDEEPVREFHRIVRVGSVDGPIQPKGNRKRFWRWRLGGKEAVAKLYQLLGERLSPRRHEQFETVLKGTRCKRRLPDAPDCGIGTYSAYVRHKKRKEPPCEPCREAFRKYMRSWRARRAKQLVSQESHA